MRRWRILVPLLLLSFAFFAAAAFAPSDDQAILYAIIGALIPSAGLIAIALGNMLRWRRMGKALGLMARESGAYPDLEGRYKGRRLIILRRTNVSGVGPPLTTIIRLEGAPDVRLPGLMANAATVRGLLEPLL